LQPDGETPEYLQELRLQNLDRLDLGMLRTLSDIFDKPKLRRATEAISELAHREAEEFEEL